MIFDLYNKVLISTYWNVNITSASSGAGAVNVLISTYWNVNPSYNTKTIRPLIVLISTYWNVNLIEREFDVYKCSKF